MPTNEQDDHLDRVAPDDEEVEIVEESEEEIEPVETIFINGHGFVAKEDADKISQQSFYGNRLDDGRLELEPVEILHLLERKRIALLSPEGVVLTQSDVVSALLSQDPNLWTRYLVFRDLRSRGYAVRQGFGSGIGFRVYARGDKPGQATANQFIYVLGDGQPISLQELALVTEIAAGNRKKLVFALVDQIGEVNFYKVAQASLNNRTGD